MSVDYWVTVVDHWDKMPSDISQQVPQSCEEPKSLSWNSRAFCTYGTGMERQLEICPVHSLAAVVQRCIGVN